MEKDWPALEECPQYRHGLMDSAVYRYPWEEDGYVFDFDSFYPPIPDEPPWFRKVVESTKNKVRPAVEDTDCCPICLPLRRASPSTESLFKRGPVPMTYDPELELEMERARERKKMEMKEIREHPVWNMDPIPCPFHILDHFYQPIPDSGVVISPPSLVTPEQLESTKKFLKEVRATRGYNVRSTLHPCLVSSYDFRQDNLDDTIYNSSKTTRDFLIEHYLNSLIDHINFKTGKIYKLVNVLKSIPATPLVLLTFSAAASPAPQQTFIATVFELSLCPLSQIRPGSNPNILECLLLPDYDAPCKTKPWDEEEIRKESFTYIKNKMTVFLGDAETTKRSSTQKRKRAEVGEGSHPIAQKRGPCVVAEERETDASELVNLLKTVEETKKRELELAAELKKRELVLAAELEEVRAKLVNLAAQGHLPPADDSDSD